MKILFVDESGDHNLSAIDPQYPLFVLGGVIVDSEYAESPLNEALDRFMHEMFGRSDIVLHTADITRNRSGFEDMNDGAFRSRFYCRLNELMRDLSYSVVACVIRKDDYLGRYGLAALDPYLISLGVLVELFCFDVGDVPKGGTIVAERRDPALDRGLRLAWSNLKVRRTRRIRGRTIEERMRALELRDKKDNLAGLQLADLVVSPIGRYVLGKPTKEDWEIVMDKLRRSPTGRRTTVSSCFPVNEKGQPPLRSNQPMTIVCRHGGKSVK